MKIKNLKFVHPLNRIKKKNINTKKNTILMIGSLKSTFVVDGLQNLNDNLIKDLEDLRNEVDFEINIIGKFTSEKTKYPNLNKSWIKYLGWIDDVNPYFKESCMLLVPSQYKLSVRTKILDAFSAGLPVVTYENNNFDKKLFLKNENTILAENKYSLIEGIKKLLIDDNFRSKISNNSFKTYHLNVDPHKIIANNIGVVNNALRFVNVLQGSGAYMKFRDEEDQTSVQFFCRVRAAEANFSNSPTFVSGSLNEIRQKTMKGNPTTYITGVELYNGSGQMVATGKLSSPLKKNFSSEATIKVKLTY